MRRTLTFSILSFCLLLTISGFAQSPLQGIVEKLQENQRQDLQEKLFVHLDRTFYATGENIWFKVYVVDGITNKPLDVSKVAYLEVLDRNNNAVIQTKIKLENGVGNGVISIPVSIETDNYTVRAYTNWMKNFSPAFFFHQSISVANLFQRLEEKATASNNYDVQFFPEGGNLVAGIKSKVAFRAVNQTGNGIDFKGAVINQKGDTITKFSPLKFGIGHFSITPQTGDDYHVVLKQKNGQLIHAKMPTVSKSGYSIFIRDTTQQRIKITISTTENNTGGNLYFIGHTRQVVKVASVLNMHSEKLTFMINKSDLGEGISHLTVFNNRIEPVCERLYFKKPEARPNIALTANQKVFEPRSKVTLQANASAITAANTSLSVFRTDSLSSIRPADIESNLWLTSELKGNIESPEFYFTESPIVSEALDNLMLTHGWSRFKWDDVVHSANKQLKFLPEYRGHLIEGIVKGVNTNQPLLGIPGYLSAPDKKIELNTAYSQQDGRVLFETTNLYGNKKLVAQTGTFKDSARIEMISPFSHEYAPKPLPSLKITTNVKASLTERSISMQAEDIYYRGRVVESKTNAIDSSAFYGKAPEHYLLDDYTRFPLLEEVLREYVKGVRLRKKDNHFIFKILNAPKNEIFSNDPLVLLDGVAIFDIDKIMEIDPLKIKSIDVVTSLYNHGNFVFEGIVSVSTYKHDLAGFQFDPGTVVIDYDGLQTKKEFFAPKYETSAARQSRLPDMRNLLFWQPNLNLSNQQNLIEFYTSDLTGTFQAVLQGLTSEGKPVYETYTFKVNQINP